MLMDKIIFFALGCGALGVLYALVTAAWVSKQSAGSERMQEISDAIKEGATAFLNREYKTVAVVMVVLAALLTYLGKWTASGLCHRYGGFCRCRLHWHDGQRQGQCPHH